jgi:hypothetical protein
MLAALDGKILYQKQVPLNDGVNMLQIPTILSRGSVGIVVLRTGSMNQSIKVMR